MLQIEESDWKEAVLLLSRLIQAHPVYGSEGIFQAQEEVLSFFRDRSSSLSNDIQLKIFEDVFKASDIDSYPQYVEVEKFGPIYSDYKKHPKRNLMFVLENNQAGPTFILNGHIDVERVHLPDAWSQKEGWKSGQIVDGRMMGRGATDMLSGLISLIAALRWFSKNPTLWKGRLILAIVIDEEIGGNGTLRSLLWMKEKGLLENPTYALIAEPSDEHYCLSSLGFLHLIVETHHRPFHMGAASFKDHPLQDLAHFILSIEDLVLEVAKKILPTISTETLVCHFGAIQGGDDAAIPIPHCILEGTLFLPEDLSGPLFQAELLKEVQKKFPRLSIRWGDFHFPGADFPVNPLSQALDQQLIQKKIFRSPCDARLFRDFSIPVVIYGPGFLQQAHAIDEWISLSHLNAYLNSLIKALCYGFTLCPSSVQNPSPSLSSV